MFLFFFAVAHVVVLVVLDGFSDNACIILFSGTQKELFFSVAVPSLVVVVVLIVLFVFIYFCCFCHPFVLVVAAGSIFYVVIMLLFCFSCCCYDTVGPRALGVEMLNRDSGSGF